MCADDVVCSSLAVTELSFIAKCYISISVSNENLHSGSMLYSGIINLKDWEFGIL
jgi:hypothetical protein